MIKVLIVEDDSNQHPLLEKAFADSRIEAELSFAEDAAGVFKILGIQEFDLIIMDLILPDMNGGEIVKKLQSDPKTAAARIVFLSGALTAAGEDGEKINVSGRWYASYAKPLTPEKVNILFQET